MCGFQLSTFNIFLNGNGLNTARREGLIGFLDLVLSHLLSNILGQGKGKMIK